MTPTLPRLHAVTDRRVLELPDFLERARAIAAGSDVGIHVRGALPGRKLLDLATRLKELAEASGTRLFVNDRVDVARLVDADGVHLPARGLPVRAARSLFGPGGWVGRSAHDAREALAAHGEGADYVLLGPIWPTASHPERGALGIEAIAAAHPAALVAVGGMTAERAGECLQAGARGVAAISALWDAPDPGAAVAAFLLSFGE